MSVRAVFVFDGGDLTVFPSLPRAEQGLEVHDLDGYVIMGDDGTLIRAAADGYRVVLTPADERQPEDLRSRLRAYLLHARVGLNPALAEDPLSVAQTLLDREWAARPFRWLPWLDRRLNGRAPPQLSEE